MTAFESLEEIRSIQDFLSQMGYEAIPITENISGHLLVEVFVNGTPGLFIVDTGAGGTVVETSRAESLKLNVQKEEITFSGAGAGGQGLEVCPSTGNTIQIGKFTVHDFTISLMSLQHVSESLSKIGAHEEVTGVIGVDVLKPAKAIIDYNNMLLYLSMKTDQD